MKSKIKEIPRPEIADLQGAIREAINSFVEYEQKNGRDVRLAYIVGALEYAKFEVIDMQG